MDSHKISLSTQIKKVIGYRILFCSIIFTFIILGLTFYDLSMSMNQLRSRINEQIKPLEDFAINQAFINNLDTINLKLESFNERNPAFKIEWVHQGQPRFRTITWKFPFSWKYDYQISPLAGYHFGYFRITGGFLSDKTLVYDLFFRCLLLVIFIISVLIILYPLSYKIPEQLFINPINRFIDLISKNSTDTQKHPTSLIVELEVLENKILALLKTATEHERNKAAIELGLLSARLAHDIHSPLAALELGLNTLSNTLSKNDIMIFKNGIQSVRDIANNVLERYRNPAHQNTLSSPGTLDDGNNVRAVLLPSLLENILSQKRYEWSQQPCNVTLDVVPEARLDWVLAAPNEIKRHLSNLLNNAYEAIPCKSKGKINILIAKDGHAICINITDNGSGIPSEKLDEVLDGLSLKHSGKGLGLSEAQRYMENISGTLKIHSAIQQGTTITLTFQCITYLPWFTNHISIKNLTTALVLDDDYSMLTYWEQRLSDLGFNSKLFTTYSKASQWLEQNAALIPTTLFLADYELSEKNTNGLLFLEKITDNKNCYLVTSHAEENYFQQKSTELGIKLIPKSVLNEISIEA